MNGLKMKAITYHVQYAILDMMYINTNLNQNGDSAI
jgi:hypothetical protein